MIIYYVFLFIPFSLNICNVKDTTTRSGIWENKTGSGESDSSENIPQVDGPADHKNGNGYSFKVFSLDILQLESYLTLSSKFKI